MQCLFTGGDEALAKPGVVRSMYDPTAGTGGILPHMVIEGQESHNKIADQLFNDDRIFAVMQGMLAKMDYQAFAQKRAH